MKRSHIALLIATALLAIGLIASAVERRDTATDFDGFYQGGIAVRHGHAPESIRSGIRRYPPFFRVLMAGYTYLDSGVTFAPEDGDCAFRLRLDAYPARPADWPIYEGKPMRILPPVLPVALHGLLNVASLAIVIALSGQTLPQAFRPRTALPWVLAVVLMIPFVYTNVALSQFNAVILALAVAGMFLLHRGRDVSAGLIWALAASVKVVPLVFIAYAVYRLRWKAALSAAVGLVVLGVFVPAAYLGWDESMQQQREWLEDSGLTRSKTVDDEMRRDRVQSLRAKNMSLRATVLRLSAAARTGSLNEKPTHEDYLIAASGGRPRRATAVVVLVGMALAVVGLWPPGRLRGSRTHWHDLVLMSFLMLAISPIVWSHYLIFMLPATTALAFMALSCNRSKTAVIVAAAAYLLMMVASGVWVLQALGIPIVAALVLVIALDLARRSPRVSS